MTIRRYAGPPRWELPELMARQRELHHAMLTHAWVCRNLGMPAEQARYLRWAALARNELRYLKLCQHALDTHWSEKTWEKVG